MTVLIFKTEELLLRTQQNSLASRGDLLTPVGSGLPDAWDDCIGDDPDAGPVTLSWGRYDTFWTSGVIGPPQGQWQAVQGCIDNDGKR